MLTVATLIATFVPFVAMTVFVLVFCKMTAAPRGSKKQPDSGYDRNDPRIKVDGNVLRPSREYYVSEAKRNVDEDRHTIDTVKSDWQATLTVQKNDSTMSTVPKLPPPKSREAPSEVRTNFHIDIDDMKSKTKSRK